MEYEYKITTHGRAAMAAALALGKPLSITRVEFGRGRIAEGAELADQHEVLAYISDGAITERRHEDDRLFLTLQYANTEHPDVGTFQLAEFMVFCTDPATDRETDLLYATLGDYPQPVPAYDPKYPACVFNFPLVLILSNEIDVSYGAPMGLVTQDALERAIARHDADQTAHGRYVVAVRTRGAGKPDYGIGDTGHDAVLRVGAPAGAAGVTAVINGREYDALNMSVDSEKALDASLIIQKA